MRLLFIGDVCGEPGRKAIKQLVPKLREELELDVVIANGENVAHGKGMTYKTSNILLNSGIDYLTSGDHVFRINGFIDHLDDTDFHVLRPANYPDDIVGRGYDLLEVNGKRILIINLMGLSFVRETIITDPFRKLDEILDKTQALNPDATIVDFHGEATADKRAFGFYADGRVSAVFGTHTHVPTADAQILKKGTAYVTDAGMTGPKDSVLWVKKDAAINFQMYPYYTPFDIELEGEAVLNAVLVEINDDGKANSIERVDRTIKL